MKKEIIIRYGILLIAVIWVIYAYPSYYPLPQASTWLAYQYLNILKIPAVPFKNHLLVEFTDYIRIFDISAECSGIAIFSVFLLATFIIPKFKVKHRLIALLFIPLLFIGNTLRILLSVLFARNIGVDFSIFFHNTIGQVIIFGITVLCYILWLKITNNFPVET